jgi:hypothetical protein
MDKEPAVSQFRYDDADIDAGPISGTREVPAWAVSLVAHAAVLFLLSTSTYVIGNQNGDDVITSIAVVDDKDYKFDVIVTDIVGNSSDVNTLTSSQAAAQVVNSNPIDQMQRQLEEDILVPDAPPVNEILQPAAADMASVVETTGSSEKVGGVEGSLDRMTYEIMNSLKDRQTLVCWLFDESGSLAVRRADIADRFENIYGQLDGLEGGKNSPLKTAVIGFGKEIHFYTPEPISDIPKAVNLVRGIADDDSGEERVFTAVGMVVDKFKRFRSARDRHNCMIVIVTDERGDDYKLVEEVATYCSKIGFRVYVIGNASPFGREKGYVRYTYSDGFQQDIAVDQGPESVRMEVLDVPFWGAGRVNSGRISAGLGPYALTRLCAETNGLYLIAEDARGRNFDPTMMKDYLPDYRPIRDYEKDIAKSKAKYYLLSAAEMTRRKRVSAPPLRFRADTDNALRTEASEAQKPAAMLTFGITKIVQELEKGEEDRAKLTEPRWQAAFDLAMGRALALQARSLGYNIMMAQMKVAPKEFAKEGNNTWVLKSSPKVETGPRIRKIVEKATTYLSRVVDDHSGTPFAYLAEIELQAKMGWTWQESFVNYAEVGRMRANSEAANRVLFLEIVDPKTGKKTKVKRVPPEL